MRISRERIFSSGERLDRGGEVREVYLHITHSRSACRRYLVYRSQLPRLAFRDKPPPDWSLLAHQALRQSSLLRSSVFRMVSSISMVAQVALAYLCLVVPSSGRCRTPPATACPRLDPEKTPDAVSPGRHCSARPSRCR